MVWRKAERLRRRIRQKGRQRSSLLFGGRTWMLHLPFSSKDDFKKEKNGRTFILGGWGFGLVWTGRSSMFPKHPIYQVSVLYSSISLNHPGATSAWNWINLVSQRAATTFVFSSVRFFLLYMQKGLIHCGQILFKGLLTQDRTTCNQVTPHPATRWVEFKPCNKYCIQYTKSKWKIVVLFHGVLDV